MNSLNAWKECLEHWKMETTYSVRQMINTIDDKNEIRNLVTELDTSG